ncbi:hypothetical protein B296_00013537, partial [Ensete ventricosum]
QAVKDYRFLSRKRGALPPPPTPFSVSRKRGDLFLSIACRRLLPDPIHDPPAPLSHRFRSSSDKPPLLSLLHALAIDEMGFLETGVPLKRTAPLLHYSSAAGRRPRLRSRVSRFLIKVDYLHWAFAVAVFFLVVVLFQAFLPGSTVEGPPREWGSVLEGVGDLDFGDGIKFVPAELVQRLERENREANASAMAFGGPLKRFPLRKPQLAVLKIVSIVAALKESGFGIQVSREEDFLQWHSCEFYSGETCFLMVNLTFALVCSLLQEPFRSVPVIWTIHESSPALRLDEYSKNGQFQLVNEWKQVFSRATVIVFPTHSMPVMHFSDAQLVS